MAVTGGELLRVPWAGHLLRPGPKFEQPGRSRAPACKTWGRAAPTGRNSCGQQAMGTREGEGAEGLQLRIRPITGFPLSTHRWPALGSPVE